MIASIQLRTSLSTLGGDSTHSFNSLLLGERGRRPAEGLRGGPWRQAGDSPHPHREQRDGSNQGDLLDAQLVSAKEANEVLVFILKMNNLCNNFVNFWK